MAQRPQWTDARRTTAELATITAHTDKVWAAAFSPAGPTLATAGEDKVVRLWDIADPRHPVELPVLSGHATAIVSLAFSSDGAVAAALRLSERHDIRQGTGRPSGVRQHQPHAAPARLRPSPRPCRRVADVQGHAHLARLQDSQRSHQRLGRP
ncbi:hypothetical protein ADL03_21020 [Nocardia sp. NRRL S-836]|nr:hypothetical protein ADL03_21020 [Nocardia sp. NRRL S-836]